MGHLTRRLTYQPGPRRFSLPVEFVSQHGLQTGSQLVMVAPRVDLRALYPLPLWQALEATLGLFECPPPFRNLLAGAVPLQLGSQSRLVLPPPVAFESQAPMLRLFWTMEAGVLVIRAENEPANGPRLEGLDTDTAHLENGTDEARGNPCPAPSPPSYGSSGQNTVPPVAMGEQKHPGNPASIARNELSSPTLVPPGPVREVPLERIHGFAPDLRTTDYDRRLADEIAAEGMTRPVVLSGHAPYRVIDGIKRLKVAQAIGMDCVPAIILGGLSRKDIAKLRYLLETTSDRWATARQLRTTKSLQENGCSMDDLCLLFRKQKRTIQRYLRIAQDPELVRAIETGDISLIEAEHRISRKDNP